MKFFKVILVVLFICVVFLSIFLFLKLKTIDKGQVKALVEKSVSDALGKEVEIEKFIFRFSFKTGILINIKNMNIFDLVHGKKQSYIDIKEVDCGVDIGRLLLDRVFYVKYVDIKSLVVNIVKDEQGAWNYENKSNGSEEDQSSLLLNVEVSGKKNSKNNITKKIPKFFIGKIHVDDLEMLIVDSSVYPPTSIAVSKGRVDIDNFVLNEAFDFQCYFALFDDERNFKVDGTILIDEQSQQTRLDDIRFDLDLLNVSFNELGFDFSDLSPEDVGQISLNVNSIIHQMILSQKGVLVLLSNHEIEDGEIVLGGLPFTFKNMNLKSEVSEADIVINDFSFSVASGFVEGKGRFSDYLFDTHKISYELQAVDVNIPELIEKNALPLEIEGKLYGSFKGSGKKQDDLFKGLDGAGTFKIKDARLIDFNLLKFVLEQMSVIPNLAQRIEENLSPEKKQKLNEKNTEINESDIVLELKTGEVYMKKIEIGTDEFLLSGTGKLNMNGQLDLEARIVILKEFSTSLIAAVEEFSYLRNDEGQIVIPFIPFSGRMEALKGLWPDVTGLGKRFIENKGVDELKKVIFKALDIEQSLLPTEVEEGSPEMTLDESNGDIPASGDVSSPEIDLLDNLLDSIF